MAYAQRLADSYAANSHVDSVILGGSVARGHADQYSDVELGVFWKESPSEQERREAAERAGADIHRLWPEENGLWADDLFAGRDASDMPKSGLLVEVSHFTTGRVEQFLDAVLVRFDPDEEKQNLLSAIADGIPLRSSTCVADWKKRLEQYPDGLALAVIERHAQIDHFWRWEMWLARSENLMMLYDAFTQVEKKLLHILLALNHVYYFGFKWMDVFETCVPVCPPEFFPRLRSIYRLPPDRAAAELASLIEQTYDLIEKHYPAVDVERLRTIFRYRRSTWQQPLAWK
jgi:hypothetical protein